ncbi:MAG: hypothetical protein LBB13_01515 [Rickettsiales bacterium]|jgi:hypothetical protein|nr:hypothetical protein [Rickettsiales bacterium]
MSEEKTKDKLDDELDREGSRLSRKIFRIDKEKGELEEKEEVTGDDIKLLRQAGLLEESSELDYNYFPPQFVEQLIKDIREKYPELVKDLPITFANCSKYGATMETEDGSGLTILYGLRHTRLITRRQLDNSKTEIYVMDSHANSKDSFVENAYGDPEKFVVKYPDTELSIKDSTNSLGIQKDAIHCISYAICFAKKIYKTVKTDMKENRTDNVIESFGRVMDKLENHRERTTTDCDKTEGKERNMFLMPDFLLEYSGSEETLDVAIGARNIESDKKKTELGEKLKRKLLPYKRKRAEELEKRLAPLEKKLNEILDTAEELGRERGREENREKIEEHEVKIREELRNSEIDLNDINYELRKEFAPARNWRNKHFKMVANRVREGKYPV